jgi:hypothetical protein
MADANTQALIAALQNAVVALTQTTTNAQVAVTNAIDGVVNNLPAALAGAINAPPAAGPFLRTPLSAGIANALDLNHKNGRKYYEKATESLFPTGEGFDVEPAKFQTLVNVLTIRAKDLGFFELGQIAMVPPDPAQSTQWTIRQRNC